GVSQGRLEEEQRVRIFTLHRRSQPAEMLHDELREEVPQLRRLRLVAGRIVLNRFRASDIVDSDDQRLDLGVLRGRVEVEAEQSQRDQGDEDESELQVRVEDQGRAVELHELALRAVQRFRVQ